MTSNSSGMAAAKQTVGVGKRDSSWPWLYRLDGAVTRFSVATDQLGLGGLIRQLHGLGIVFLSVGRQ